MFPEDSVALSRRLCGAFSSHQTVSRYVDLANRARILALNSGLPAKVISESEAGGQFVLVDG